MARPEKIRLGDLLIQQGLLTDEQLKFALDEQIGHRSSTLVNLGACALRLNRTLHFDPDTQLFIGDDAANRLIDQPMRGPWHI